MTVRILVGDCRDTLATLPEQSVQTCVTSPPYFGLRDYGHAGQIGLEPTPDAFVAQMVAVFRDVRRVLTDDGTLWLNLGDSYAAGKTGRGDQDRNTRNADGRNPDNASSTGAPFNAQLKIADGCKPKDLIGIPWRVAFALQADGWYLRSDIIWHKPNPMPESVSDRPTKSHEYLFLLTKSERYYYNADAIAEERISEDPRAVDGFVPKSINGKHSPDDPQSSANRKQDAIGKQTYTGFNDRWSLNPTETRNKRTVWTVPTSPFKGAHFATFPPALIEPCIKAGSKQGDTVLDPFGGAGTTGLVADRLGREAILCELNPAYADIARKRIADDNPLFSEVA